MKIHAKLVSFVVVALVIPFLMGVSSIRYFGKSYYQNQQGVVQRMIAEELSSTLEDGIWQKFKHISVWVDVSPLSLFASAVPVFPFSVEAVEQVESRWPVLTKNDEPLKTILSNPLSNFINAFQDVHPDFAEILMTDRDGRVIGATNPTTDYWQADESWWRDASNLPAGSGAIRGLLYDESADLLSFDMVFPIYDSEQPNEFVGVLKASSHATYLLQQAAPDAWNKEIVRDVYFPDGRLLTHIDSGVAPECSQIPLEVLQELLAAPDGWGTVEISPGTLSLAAAVPIQIMNESFVSEKAVSNGHELYVVVSRDLNEVMMPIRDVLRQLTAWAVVTAILFASLSYLLVTYWFVRPIKKIRNASLSLVDYIKLGEQGRFEELWEAQQEASRRLDELKTIRSHDELQDLSRDFIRMGERMISFLRQIEEKLIGKKRE